MLAVVGSPLRLIDMSDDDVATDFVAELLPPAPVPPLESFVAPVVAVTVTDPVVVGVPETEQEMLAPAATDAGGVGVQVPTVTPGGNPLIKHVAATAAADADGLLAQTTVPEYGTPTVDVAGSPDRSGCISELLMTSEVVAELFAALLSLTAPVVPFSVDVPVAVGVPETVHEIDAPGATVAGGAGVQFDVKPAGSPAMAHDALVAATAGDVAFVHVYVPL